MNTRRSIIAMITDELTRAIATHTTDHAYCPNCHDVFKRTRTDRVFCSKRCWGLYHSIPGQSRRIMGARRRMRRSA